MTTEQHKVSQSVEERDFGRRGFLKTAGIATAGTALYSSGMLHFAQTAGAAGPAVSDVALQNPRWAVKPFPLHQVSLSSGSIFAEKRNRILSLLAGYPADRVLHNFRVTAGLPIPPNSSPPGGWDDGAGKLRGHYSGHLITAFSQAHASSSDPLYKDKVDYIVAELGKCQDALDETVGDPAPAPAPVEWVGGKFGHAVRLNGQSQHVSLPAGIVSDLADVTIALWVNPQTTQSWSRIFDFGTGTTRNMFLAASAGSGPRFAITTSGGGGEQQLNAPSQLPTNTWSHVAVTLRGNTGTLYVDGSAVAVNNNMTLTPASLGVTDRNWIGKSQYGDPLLSGLVDEFQIHDRALTGDEIRALTVAADGGLSSGWVARYQLDETTGTKAADSSGHGRDATVISEESGPPGPEYPGFLSAYPETQFIRLETFATYPTIWAPYYTLHKIMRGLLDAYVLVGNQQALDIVSRMGDWVHNRLSRCSREQLNRMWAIYIAGECGAMNEVMADLHAITGKAEYLEAAKCFDNRQSLFGACVQNQDILTRLHANTHVPQFVGYMRVFDQTNDRDYFTAVENFWRMVVPHRMYSHGGTSGTWPSSPGMPANTNPELFQPRGNIANSIAGNGAETCTSYNMLKVSRYLFFHTADPKYMDYYERTLLNHILGSRADTDTTINPQVTYFLPLSPGNQRGYGNTGTCCGGTGLENHTKYQESIYFRANDDSALFVNLYSASTLTWADKGFVVTQETDYPRADSSRITVNGTGRLDIKLRVPSWCEGFSVSVNGVRQNVDAEPGTYLTLSRAWSPMDRIDVSIPFSLRVEKALDKPEIQSVFNGPVVLPALSPETSYRNFSFYKDLKLDGQLTTAITPAGGGTYTTNGHTLRPLYVGDSQRHHIYYRRYEPTVVFGSVDSGVQNYQHEPDGATLLDAIWDNAPFANHGEFMSVVARVSGDWRKRGLLTQAERTAIVEAADRAEQDLAL